MHVRCFLLNFICGITVGICVSNLTMNLYVVWMKLKGIHERTDAAAAAAVAVAVDRITIRLVCFINLFVSLR